MIWAAVSAGVLLRNEQASSSARTGDDQYIVNQNQGSDSDTSQSIYGPLLELLKSDFSGGRDLIEVQSVGIFLLLVCWDCELLLLVIKCTPPLRVYTTVVLSDHCNI